jgi:LPXTG-motif cell wall-anchored protein
MRYILPLLFLPTPALAHAGPHLHPHGIDMMWLLVVGLLALAGGYFIGRGRK